MGMFRRILYSALAAACVAGTAACGGGGAPTSASSSQLPGGGAAPLLLYPASGAGGSIATPAPVGALSENLAFTVAGAQAEILVYQAGNTGSFTVTPACQTPSMPTGATGVATAAFGNAIGPGAVLTVTAGTNGGTCVFTITGASAKTATVFVGNTATTGNVN